VNASDLVEFLQRLLKSSGETAEVNSMLTRSECKVPSSDPAGGNPLVNINFLTMEKYPASTRRRFEVQVMYIFKTFLSYTRDTNIICSLLHSGS
jgi:hypothetical protein